MSLRFRRFDDAVEYAARVRPFLLAAEAENNVLLGILPRVIAGDHEYREPILLAAVERVGELSREAWDAGSAPTDVRAQDSRDAGLPHPDSDIVGCVWRTPPYKLGMTALPATAAAVAATGVYHLDAQLDVALGPADTVSRFARAWSKLSGATFRFGMRQGVYELDRVNPPSNRASGEMVIAEAGDLPLAVEWGHAFRRDTHVHPGDPEVLAKRLSREGSLFFWVDGGKPRSMAAAVAFTDNGARVGWVYTPREARGRGYATALVADLSQRLLDEGRQFCFLFADLSNPTSTGIYERLGYRKVVEALDVIFDN